MVDSAVHLHAAPLDSVHSHMDHVHSRQRLHLLPSRSAGHFGSDAAVGLQVLSVSAQGQLRPRYSWLSGADVDAVGCERDFPGPKQHGHGRRNLSTLLRSLLWGAWPRSGTHLHGRVGVSNRGVWEISCIFRTITCSIIGM